MNRHGQQQWIDQLELTSQTEQLISGLLLDAYRAGALVIEHHKDGETWLSDGGETLIISLPANSAAVSTSTSKDGEK